MRTNEVASRHKLKPCALATLFGQSFKAHLINMSLKASKKKKTTAQDQYKTETFYATFRIKNYDEDFRTSINVKIQSLVDLSCL